MEKVHIVAARRTPIGKFLGAFANTSAVELGVTVVQQILKDTQIDPKEIGQVLFGQARQAGNGPNPARQVSIQAGIPQEVTAYTINMACASGLKAIFMGAQEIQFGHASAVIVGGMENMTQVPFLLPEFRNGYRLGHAEVIDGMYRDGFHCPLADQLMGRTAETLAEQYQISREEQDQFAVQSQKKCSEAQQAGHFNSEITPVEVQTKKGSLWVKTDEHPREDTTFESLKKLKPVFKDNGTVHAGNSSGITDGAAALLLVSDAFLQAHQLKSLAFIEAYTEIGVDPKIMGIGPVPAVKKLLKQTHKTIQDFECIELNEAFAAQVIACQRELQFKNDALNKNGGSIALGHPIGATGSRIVVTLLHELIRTQQNSGLATLCVSGGMGVALALNRT